LPREPKSRRAADAVVKLISSLGGYAVLPVNTTLAPSAAWPAHVTAYALSTLPYADYQEHEIAIVLPFGAVLAARVLAKRLTQARLLPVLAVVACGYLAALGYGIMIWNKNLLDQFR
jgi:hypothetical protein